MPQTDELTRMVFMRNGAGDRDDGISLAEDIIKKAGGSVDKGVIKLPLGGASGHHAVRLAATFLLEEWDYALDS